MPLPKIKEKMVMSLEKDFEVSNAFRAIYYIKTVLEELVFESFLTIIRVGFLGLISPSFFIVQEELTQRHCSNFRQLFKQPILCRLKVKNPDMLASLVHFQQGNALKSKTMMKLVIIYEENLRLFQTA